MGAGSVVGGREIPRGGDPALALQRGGVLVPGRRIDFRELEPRDRAVARHPLVADSLVAQRVAPPEMVARVPRVLRSDVRLRPARAALPELHALDGFHLQRDFHPFHVNGTEIRLGIPFDTLKTVGGDRNPQRRLRFFNPAFHVLGLSSQKTHLTGLESAHREPDLHLVAAIPGETAITDLHIRNGRCGENARRGQHHRQEHHFLDHLHAPLQSNQLIGTNPGVEFRKHGTIPPKPR